MAAWRELIVRNFDDALDVTLGKYLGIYMVKWRDVKESLYYEDEFAAAGLIGSKVRDSDSDSDSTDEDSDRVETQNDRVKPGKRGFRFFDPQGTDLPRGSRLARKKSKGKKWSMN